MLWRILENWGQNEYFVCGNNLVFTFYGIYLFLGVVWSMMLNTKAENIEYGFLSC